ncbi:MAG: DUF302 domain-containing protein [Phenylobacterium sp.]|jgi:uncharacterized protein (DUF302 family)|uniref:DUF302 domain-containing protein n=1 Tax=Phenylobacterium sp. TaxID=1871053 RepID=UPI000BD93539|nr:DUF302 domain-containing protein [Phenylobacterium sp.]MDO8411046.1 DUF302 domain-containing protein [Phenylobacterium sp.]OYW16034.1 MAG: hypothetical protein B7Z39_03040 [Novosphingobium sp. 12-64-8]OYX29204.1 MAG: hypothetical protein B7Y99_13560 [Caulobacterales bacterium 32-69-10]
MSYYHAKILNLPFDAALAAAREALAQQGFGVVTELDIHQTLQAKLGESFRPYTILGACNPRLAYEALQLEDKVGTMLPCNVVVQQRSDESTEVAAIDPVASMQAIDNPELKEKAGEVAARLRAAIDGLGSVRED